MKTQKYRSLGLDINLSVPSDVKEFDANAKREGACLAEAINNIVYRGSLAEFRDVFLHGDTEAKIDGIDQEIARRGVKGLERKYETKKNKDGSVSETWVETEADFFKRVCETLKVEPSAFQGIADKVAASIAFDASATERKPAGPKKLAQKYKDTAVALLKGPHVKRFTADVKKAIGLDLVITGDLEKDTEPIGWAIKRFSEWKEAQELAKLVGA